MSNLFYFKVLFVKIINETAVLLFKCEINKVGKCDCGPAMNYVLKIVHVNTTINHFGYNYNTH